MPFILLFNSIVQWMEVVLNAIVHRLFLCGGREMNNFRLVQPRLHDVDESKMGSVVILVGINRHVPSILCSHQKISKKFKTKLLLDVPSKVLEKFPRKTVNSNF